MSTFARDALALLAIFAVVYAVLAVAGVGVGWSLTGALLVFASALVGAIVVPRS